MNLFKQTIIFSLLVVLLASCATKEVRKPEDTSGDIEIKEEYGVDEQVNEMFKEAVAAIRDEKYQQAIDLLTKVTEQSEKHSAPYVNLGIAYLKLGKVKESEDNLLKALKINPDHPVTNNELGIVYRKSGRFDEAKKLYLHVLKKYPLFLPARKNLGILCDLFMKDFHCAVEQYEAYLKQKPDDKKVQIWLTDVKRRVK